MLKILFTIAIVAILIIGFKYRARIAKVHREVMAQKARDATKRGATAPPAEPKAQDLLPCPKCGSYIAAGTVCACEAK